MIVRPPHKGSVLTADGGTLVRNGSEGTVFTVLCPDPVSDFVVLKVHAFLLMIPDIRWKKFL